MSSITSSVPSPFLLPGVGLQVAAPPPEPPLLDPPPGDVPAVEDVVPAVEDVVPAVVLDVPALLSSRLPPPPPPQAVTERTRLEAPKSHIELALRMRWVMTFRECHRQRVEKFRSLD
jgi:hypothetical protein